MQFPFATGFDQSLGAKHLQDLLPVGAFAAGTEVFLPKSGELELLPKFGE